MHTQLFTLVTLLIFFFSTFLRAETSECFRNDDYEEVCVSDLENVEDSVQLPNAIIVGRHVYYAGTKFEYRIDESKVALVADKYHPVESSEKNYTNFVGGINGIAIDMKNVGEISSDDFELTLSNGLYDIATLLPIKIKVSKLIGAGLYGTDRILLHFPYGGIKNAWVKVTVKATKQSNLDYPDTFYFGNAVADAYIGNIGKPMVVRTNITDVYQIRRNQTGNDFKDVIEDKYDLNKDGRVNATDIAICRQNQSSFLLKMITLSAKITR